MVNCSNHKCSNFNYSDNNCAYNNHKNYKSSSWFSSNMCLFIVCLKKVRKVQQFKEIRLSSIEGQRNKKKNECSTKRNNFESSRSGVPNLGDASPWGDMSDLKSVISWVHLYQWGDADTKRLGTPVLDHSNMSQYPLKFELKSFKQMI